MPVDLSYATNLTQQYDAVKVAMERTLAAELTHVVPVLRWVMAGYVGLQFWKFALGQTPGLSFTWALARAVFVIFFLTRAGAYTENISTYAFEKLPAAAASVATASNILLTAPQQFDVVSTAIDNLTADIRRRNTGWSVSAFGNSLMTWAVNGTLQWWLAVEAQIWMVSIRLMAITLCLGVWMMMFELFEATRGWFRYWIGVVVGIVIFQLACAIYLQISLHTQMDMLRQIHESSNGSDSPDIMIANLIDVGNAIFGDALTMICLPTICAIGGGGAAHVAAQRATTGFLGAAHRTLSPR